MATTTLNTEIIVGTDPDNQPVLVDPIAGSGLVAGTGQTGKSRFLACLVSGAALAGAQVHVFDLAGTGRDYTDIDPAALCVGSSSESLETAVDVLTTLCETMETRYRASQQTGTTRTSEQPILVVVDECQLWFESDLGDVFERLVTRLVKMGRAAGIMVWVSTSVPDGYSIPTTIVRNLGYRVGFNLAGPLQSDWACRTTNDFVLGAGAYNNDINSIALADHTAWIIKPTSEPALTRINP